MKAQTKKKTNLMIGAMLAIAAIAIAFWVMALGPKRDEANKLGQQVESLEAELAKHQAEADAAAQARRSFATDYSRLVVLGKAVPAGDETASLLVQLNKIAARAKVRFETLQLNSSGGGGSEASAAPSSVPSGSATEAAASLMPLGATVGPAGLAVMPYTLTFEGNFFTISDFIHGLDSLVKTTNQRVAVDGRLITIDGFSLAPAAEGGFPNLLATFSVTTYLTPPGQGLTGGASPTGPATGSSTLASATVGATP